jgi:hypothetical protein
MSFIADLLDKALPGLLKPLLPYIVCLALGAGGGAFAVWHLFPRIVEKEVAAREVENPVKFSTQSATETKIEYVERAANERAQVKIDTAPPQVVARINGQDFAFEGIPGEKHAFEKGQLVIRQESAATIDLTAWANKELATKREEIKREFYKPHGISVAALVGIRQSYAGVEYENRSFVVGAYRSLSGSGDKRLIKAGWRWRF